MIILNLGAGYVPQFPLIRAEGAEQVFVFQAFLMPELHIFKEKNYAGCATSLMVSDEGLGRAKGSNALLGNLNSICSFGSDDGIC